MGRPEDPRLRPGTLSACARHPPLDPARLPPPARKAFFRYTHGFGPGACQVVTTVQAERLFAAFAKARVKFVDDYNSGDFAFLVPGKDYPTARTDLAFVPQLPGDAGC